MPQRFGAFFICGKYVENVDKMLNLFYGWPWVVMVTFFGNGNKIFYKFTTDAPPFC